MKLVYLDRNNQVVCIGDSYGCKNYIKQLYSVNINDLECREFPSEGKYVNYYEDYEVVQIRGTDIFLTLGQVKMMKRECMEDIRGIKLIQEELNNLSTLNYIFNDKMINELNYMRDYMDEVYKVYTRYNTHNLFENLDIDVLHSMYKQERENKGLPIVYL